MISNVLTAARSFKSTGINAENIAVMSAFLRSDSRTVVFMSKEELKNEKPYQTTMYMVRKLFEDGTITEEEYRQIDTIFLEKYHPIFGTLLSGISLTSGA